MANNPVERRRFGRRQTFKPATLVDDGDAHCDGIVIDLSEGGARIRLTDPQSAPKTFTLLIPADDFCAPCRLVHVREDSIGVEFTGSPRRMSWRPSGNRASIKKSDGT